MSSVKYDYELDLELDLDLNFSDNIGYQFGEIANLLIEAEQLALSSFEFADLIQAIASKEDNVAYIVKEAQKLGIEFDFVEDIMQEFEAEKKQLMLARDNRYKTHFYNDYCESKLKTKESKATTKDVKINQVIAARLKMMRWKLGLSQDQLGAVIEVSAEQLDKCERGIEKISDDKINLLIEFFRIPANYFFMKPLIKHDENRPTSLTNYLKLSTATSPL